MDIMELLKTRRTYRRFKQDPVPDSVVENILTAARYASSAANKQPLSFVVVKSPEMVKRPFRIQDGPAICRLRWDSQKKEKSRRCL